MSIQFTREYSSPFHHFSHAFSIQSTCVVELNSVIYSYYFTLCPRSILPGSYYHSTFIFCVRMATYESLQWRKSLTSNVVISKTQFKPANKAHLLAEHNHTHKHHLNLWDTLNKYKCSKKFHLCQEATGRSTNVPHQSRKKWKSTRL